MSERGLTRRGLFTLWKRPEAARVEAKAAPAPPRAPPPRLLAPLVREQQEPPVSLLVRPPGALPEEQFLDACRRCGKCVEACPHDAIAPLAEGPHAGTPAIDTRQAPCRLCEGLQCTTACPSGALTPLFDARAVQMGTAVIDAAACLAYRGAPCRVCSEVCPLPGIIKLAKGARAYVPVAGPEACVGCGLCHRHCPEPLAIRIEPGAKGPLRVAHSRC